MDKRNVKISLTPEQHAQAKRLANHFGVSIEEIVRQAIKLGVGLFEAKLSAPEDK